MRLFWGLCLIAGVLISGTNCTQCRWSGGYITPPEFHIWSCSQCLIHVFLDSKPLTTNITQTFNLIDKYNRSAEYVPDADNSDSEVCREFLSGAECTTWRDCCRAAWSCCNRMMQQNVADGGTSDQTCPMTWDGVDCWQQAEPQTLTRRPCPPYYVKDVLRASEPYSSKNCTASGHWFRRTNEWTNYSLCWSEPDRTNIIKLSVYIGFGGYAVSLISIILASYFLIILPSLRREEQALYRFRLTMNMFAAFIFLDVCTVGWESEFYLKRLNGVGYENLNTSVCRVVKLLQLYFRGATFWWLFCQGLFLHRRLKNWAFADCPESLLKYYLIGWALSLVPAVIWASIHFAIADTNGCWDYPYNAELVFMIPNLAAIMMNLLMLLDIQRMIMTTLRSARNEPIVVVIRHSLKATLSLIPLFGLQMLLVSFRPENWLIYDVIEAILVSTQGLLVACFYCLTKREVRAELARSLRQHRLMSRSSLSGSGGTVSTRFSSNSVTDTTRGQSMQMQIQSDSPIQSRQT